MSPTSPELPPELAEGVAFFTQLLAVRPGDLTALTYLVLAYDLAGAQAERDAYIPQLAAAFLRQRESEPAERLLALLPEAQQQAPAIVQLYKRAEIIRNLEAYRAQLRAAPEPEAGERTRSAHADEGSSAAAAEPTPDDLAAACARSEERCLAWLREHNLVSEALAEEVAKRLEALASAGHTEAISTLLLIEEIDGAQLEGCLVGLVQHFGVAPVPVQGFRAEAELLALMPEAEVRMRGVLPFATMAGKLLVATLNPVDEPALARLSERLAKPCLFYLMRPSAFRAACEKRYAQGA